MAGRSGQVRIIGGDWRGRKLAVPEQEGLRPTSDRIRETLFNWLMYEVAGRRCLDLFAGSGALGFEAASRGAAHVDLVESNREVVGGLKQAIGQLNAAHVEVHQADAIRYLADCGQTYDLVFLDPPFQMNLLEACADALETNGSLAQNAWIYVEAAKTTPMTGLPAHWRQHRHKKSGQVGYYLYQREPQT